MSQPRRIMVVEDEPDIREALSEFLKMQIADVEVTPAGSGQEALALLPSVRPDIILTDYKMPGMTGLEFLAAARAFAPETPRILMTAFPDLDVATRAINDAHIENFLPKPVDPKQLVAKIDRIFEIEAARRERESALARTLRELQDALASTRS